MKVVINTCFGGFGLSDEAMRLYAKKKGITLYPEIDHRLVIYYTVPPEKRTKPLENWHDQPLEARKAYNEAYSKECLYGREFTRNDPTLVEVVEELGNRASGDCADLEVIEIPDGIDWEIDDYDGRERINETHRTWG